MCVVEGENIIQNGFMSSGLRNHSALKNAILFLVNFAKYVIFFFFKNILNKEN